MARYSQGGLPVRGRWKFEGTACHSVECGEYAVILVDYIQWHKISLWIVDT